MRPVQQRYRDGRPCVSIVELLDTFKSTVPSEVRVGEDRPAPPPKKKTKKKKKQTQDGSPETPCQLHPIMSLDVINPVFSPDKEF